MVVIHLKKSEQDQFLYECSIGDSNDKVTRDLVRQTTGSRCPRLFPGPGFPNAFSAAFAFFFLQCKIHNMRERIARLAMACEELAKHGPSKPDAEKGIDEIVEKAGGKSIKKGEFYNPDPLGNRDGNAPSPQLAEVIRKTCEDAKALASSNKAAMGVALTVGALQEKIDNIRGAVTMAYPMGLPEWDPVRLLIEDDDEGSDGGGPGAAGAGAGAGAAKVGGGVAVKGNGFLSEQMGNEYMDPATASLWWAGKEFFRDQTVGDR
jgi:cilia- and flagella-associated protein 298